MKTKGVSILGEITAEGGEAVITVRGKNKYIVLSLEEYNQFREYELEAAMRESEEDIRAGRIVEETIAEHIKRINGV